MKKLLTLLILLICTLLLLTSCGEDEITLNVYNWGEYISDGDMDTVDTNAEFEKYYKEKYGVNVKVIYTTYATNEDMYSKLSSGAGEGVYDVIFPSDYMLQRMAEEGMLHSFDVEAEIPNYKYIADEFKGLYYDKYEQYSVPYTYGTVGIIYNPTMMDPADLDENGEINKKSWSLLWNEGYVGDYSGQILQFNNPRDAFGTAMYYQNIDINTSDRAKWEEALVLLRQQKNILQGYVNDEIFNKMTSSSAAIAPYFAGDYVTMADTNEDLKFFYPEEGTNAFVDVMCIPESSTKKDIAKEYINFMLSPTVAIANAEYVGYASPNTLVRDDPDYIESMGDAYDILYGYSVDELNVNYDYDPYYHSFSNTEMYGDDMQMYVNGLWEKLKTETDVELWVHISSIGIVVALVGLCSYNIYIKKKRSSFYRKRDKK